MKQNAYLCNVKRLSQQSERQRNGIASVPVPVAV